MLYIYIDARFVGHRAALDQVSEYRCPDDFRPLRFPPLTRPTTSCGDAELVAQIEEEEVPIKVRTWIDELISRSLLLGNSAGIHLHGRSSDPTHRATALTHTPYATALLLPYAQILC